MDNNSNLYENYIPNNNSKNIYKTQPYQYFQSPSSQKQYSQTINHFQNMNPNSSSGNKTTYNKQTLQSPHSINSLKWRNLMKIDLLLLKNSRDLNLVEPNIDNLVFGQVSEDDIQSLPEANIVKLIQILQTVCDILLNEQQDLENELIKLENENIKTINDYKKKDKIKNKYKDLIHELKKDKRRGIDVLKTYFKVIDNLKNGNCFNFRKIKIDVKENNNNNIENAESKKEIQIKCPICKEERLVKESELQEHFDEFHGKDKLNPNLVNQNPSPIQINIQPPPDYYHNNNNNINNNEDLIRKMEERNKQFQEEFSKLQEEIKKEQENQKHPNLKDNFNEQFTNLKDTFKETLNGFKMELEQNKENKTEPNVIIQNVGTGYDYYNPKKNEILRLQEELKKINNEIDTDEKNYEIQITELKKTINTINLDIIDKKKFLEDEKNFEPKTINSKMEITHNLFEYQSKVVDDKESKDKTYFNSGKLVSDHDDTDEENKKRKKIIEEYQKNYKDIANTIIENGKQEFPDNAINQNTFFGINKDKDNIKGSDIIQEVSGDLETSINRNISNNKINLRKIDKKNIELDNYYKRYIKRDKKYLKSNKSEDYFIETLPKNFDLKISEKATNLVENKIPDIGIKIFPNNLNMVPKFQESQLKQENIYNLITLVSSLINSMDLNNRDKEGNEDNYYISIKKLIGLKGIQSNCQEIENKPRRYDIQNSNIMDKQVFKNALNNKNKLIEIDTNINSNANNLNNINIITNNIDPNKNAIMSGVVLTDIKELQTDDINKINKENEKLRNQKNKDNYIKDINTNISEIKKEPNNTIIDTTNINQQREDKNLDVPYTGTGEINQNKNLNVPYTGTGEINQNKNLDVSYTGTGEINQDRNLNVPYTGTGEINQDKKNDVPYTGTGEINQDKKNDVPYTGTGEINQDKKNDVPYTGTGEINQNKNLDIPYTGTS